MSSSDFEKQGTSAVGAFVGSQIVILELIALGFGLHYLQGMDASMQTLVAAVLVVVFAFTLITGRGFPHFRHRGKAALFGILAGFFTLHGAVTFQHQRETYLAELSESDPVAYLAELRDIDEGRWLIALEELDPAAHATEMERLIGRSDDLAQRREAFTQATTELVSEGACTLDEFAEHGGWVRSTTHGTSPVYFMYCGGATVADRLYLDASTGRRFR
ncbi:hypothetical protein ACSSNL_01425 [Thalassobius sp. S69A]|uniref:hypothetical protein n=1 Tax=unclassified Thalassovita TaxID=2619711 RepID=UPI003C7B2FBB